MRILRPAEIRLMRMGRPTIPANFGGDSESDSSVATSNTTSNTSNWHDARATAGDNAVSLSGNGNFLDRSATTNFNDSSNRSTLTSFVDDSNRSTNFSDSSNRSTTFLDASVKNTTNSTSFVDGSNRSTNYSTTDFGAVQAGMAGMSQAVTGAFNLSGNVVKTAQDVMMSSASASQNALNSAFQIAQQFSQGSTKNSADLLGMAQATMADTRNFATKAIEQAKDAFADAKDGGTKKIMLAVLAVVAVIGVAQVMKGR